ncbi:putative tetratricopeptide-like helical domain superfamily, zinc-finger domain-containing protein [Helianthus annuus]|nr:putative tetratricopeptide-like helical domain superfamily, zinc-finger domain-containing protein [Helianthus annuus]
MEETPTVIPPPPATSNHATDAKTIANSSKTREEGELSASENDEFAGSRFTVGTIVPAAALNKGTSVVEKGVSAPIHNPAVASRTVHPNKRKGTEKNRVPFVISFSDDDSGSDSEECKKGSTMESDEMTCGTVENRKFPTSMVTSRSQMVQQTSKINTKSPKKLSTSRTFVSSANRVNGTKFKNGGSTFVGVKSHLKKSNPPSIIKFGQNIHINSNKLQDLRQLIAIRENELKSKVGKPDKEVASSSKKNVPDMNLKNIAVKSRNILERVVVEPKEPEKKRVAVKSRNILERVVVEPKEPEKKRLKVSEPPRNVVVSVGQHDRPPSDSTVAAGVAIPSESTIAAGVAISVGQNDKPPPESTAATGVTISAGQHGTSALESDGLKGRSDGNNCDKEILGGPGQSSTMQQQIKEVKNRDIKNLPIGGGIISNSRQHNGITNLGESSSYLMAKTDKPSPPRQGSLMNSSFWSHFGATTGEMDIKSLLELEELQDKELDEAQEHRRKCEIEERNALKAYRKAQRELAEANSRCSYLYHKRNLFSANLRSHVMEDSNMFWSNMSHQHHTDANVNSITNMSENNVSHHQVPNECDEPEPNTSGSEPEEEGKTNDVDSSLHANNSNSNNILAEDEHEQTSAFGLKAGDSSLDSHVEGIRSERNNEVNNNSVAIDTNEDSLLLEATLRSQLFARLGNRKPKKNESGTASVEKEDGEIMEDSENIPSSEPEKEHIYDTGDIVMSEKDPVDYGSFLAEPVLKSSFGHVKFTATVSSTQSHTEKTQIHTNDIVGEKKVVNGVCGAQPIEVLDLYVSEVGSYSNNLPINPFWPLCMFELRGKCNDDECPWQHVRDYSSKNIDSNSNDRGSLCLAPPTYLVCLDSLKADSHPYKYLVAPTIEHRWKKSFSAFLVVSSSILADPNSDERCLHGPETRIEVHGVWNRQSSYFHGQNVKEGLKDEHMDGIYQRLETAFHNLSREVSKQKGRTECLIVLARALEEHPTSVLLWIVYLHIFYSNQKSIGKDDMFGYAIEHNESSYELWLMFINSREKLDDRLLGYNTAISALCRHASTPNRDPKLDSECILDLFLQMIDCLCSSGEVKNAIQQVYGLLSSTNMPTDPHAPSLPDIQKSLTIPDRCVLWLCSVYLLLYKRLPDTIIKQFECPKELSTIEWHSVQLTDDEKQQAITLLELAPEYIDSNRTAISAQRFALNHVRCTAVVKGIDSCKDLLEKYLGLYPSCSELVLLSIRVNGFDSTESTFAAFEEALSNWVGEHGIQCIWNQYAGYALETGNVDLGKEIMERWFCSISKTYYSKPGILSVSAWMSSLTQSDIVFGLLNLSLHKQLQNDHTEARIAIEQVFELASSDDYNHIVKEHAMLLLKKDSGFEKARLVSFLNMLNRYLMDPRALPAPDSLSRSFIKSIGNSKVQKFVNNLLCPVSSDSSLLNLVLESCFGPSLLPSILESFHKRALSVYPFSSRLWESYRRLYDDTSNQANAVVEMARGKGIKL